MLSALAIAAVFLMNTDVDSARGQRIFADQSCIQCHSINGEGAKIGPDLGRRIDRDYTPALLTSIMWNHAPLMWSAIEARGIARPVVDEQGAADLFAYFYSARFFDKLGDAGRGKQAFSTNHCASCHGITDAKPGSPKPVAQWASLNSPIDLAEAMWNHAANMRQEFAKQRIRWPDLTSRDLADILVYVRNLRETQHAAGSFRMAGTEGGEALFQSKGCAGCHVGKLELRPRLRGKTLADIAVDMWNHAPKMAQPPPKLEPDDMRKIVSYLWAEQLLTQSGNAAHGKQVFAAKQCATCHNDPASGAPNLNARKGGFSAVSMVAALWRHGPQMLERMKAKNMAWPRFTADQMSDLIAYLNAGQ